MTGSNFITLPVRAGSDDYKPASIALSAAGHYAAAAGFGVPGRLWTFAGLTVGTPVLSAIELQEPSVWRAVAFRPHDREEHLPSRSDTYVELAAAYNGGIERYGVAGGATKLRTLELPAATRVVYSHDGLMIAAGSAAGKVSIWHLLADNPEPLPCRIDVGSCVTALGFTHGGRQLLIGTESGADFVLDGNCNELQPLSQVYPGLPSRRLYCLAVCQERSLAAFCGDNSSCTLLNFVSGERREIQTPNALLARAEFLHHNCLALYGPDCAVLVEPQSGKLLHQLSGKVLAARQFCRTLCVMLG